MSAVRIGMGQMLVEPGRLDANLRRASEMVAQAAASGCAVVVLPECLDLGWAHESARTSSTEVPGRVSEFFRALAAEHGVILAAGLTEREGERIYNSALLISAEGEVLRQHRKINELAFARKIYSTGSSVAVARTAVGEVGLSICADNAASSVALGGALGVMGARMILSPSAWAVPPRHDNAVTPYGDEWEATYIPLAVQYDMPVIGVSNVGPVQGGEWDGWRCIGASLAVGRDGQVLARGSYGDRAEELIVVDVDVADIAAEEGADSRERGATN